MRHSRRILPLLAVSAIMLSACSLGSTSVDLSGDCRSLSNQLERWNDKVVKATNSAKEDQGTPGESQDNQDKATAQANVDKLNAALKKNGWQPDCSSKPSGSPSASPAAASATPSSDGTEDVVDHDGTTRTLPVVAANGTTINGDSTTDPRTPASYADAKKEGPLKSWADVPRIMGSQQWYKDGINVRAADTGFDWSKVQQFASAKDIDARVITVHHENITDQQARDAVRPLIGTDADKLPIYRFPGDIMNTRGFGKNTMEDFVDKRPMVRVELAAIVYKDGKPDHLDPTSGIEVDCFNLVWEYQSEQPATTAAPTSASPEQTSSAPRPGSSSASHGSTASSTSSSTRTSTSSSSASTTPAKPTKNVNDAHLGSSDTRNTATPTGDLNTQRTSSAPAPASTQAVPSGQSAPVSSAVAPSGTASAPSGVGDTNQGTGSPPPD